MRTPSHDHCQLLTGTYKSLDRLIDDFAQAFDLCFRLRRRICLRIVQHHHVRSCHRTVRHDSVRTAYRTLCTGLYTSQPSFSFPEGTMIFCMALSAAAKAMASVPDTFRISPCSPISPNNTCSSHHDLGNSGKYPLVISKRTARGRSSHVRVFAQFNVSHFSNFCYTVAIATNGTLLI